MVIYSFTRKRLLSSACQTSVSLWLQAPTWPNRHQRLLDKFIVNTNETESCSGAFYQFIETVPYFSALQLPTDQNAHDYQIRVFVSRTAQNQTKILLPVSLISAYIIAKDRLQPGAYVLQFCSIAYWGYSALAEPRCPRPLQHRASCLLVWIPLQNL